MQERAEFLQLPEQQQLYVRKHLELFREFFAHAPSIERAAHLAAQAMRGQRGYSAKALKDKWRDFRRAGGDWRVIVPAYHSGGNALGLPAEAYQQFCEWWVAYATRTKRPDDGIHGVWRQFQHEWVFGDLEVPGFGRFSTWYQGQHGHPRPHSKIVRQGELPRGVSYQNLLRILKSRTRKTDRLQHTIGYHHGHGTEPDQLLRDRSQLRFMELIAFDDVRLDVQCVFKGDAGRLQSGYANALLALDVASGCDLAFGCKPRVRREADDTHVALTREDLRFLLVGMFEQWGLPDYPVTLLIENAAAAISQADELALLDAFQGQVKIDRTRIYEKSYRGLKESGGSPWEKAWIESFFRILHTTTASLPGTTGRRYDLNPGDLRARLALTDRLIKEHGDDPAALAGRLPILPLADVQARLGHALDLLRCRVDHRLQGFNTVTEARLPDGSFVSLDDFNASLASMPAAEEVEWIERVESPAERAGRLAAQANLRPIPAALKAVLAARKRVVTLRHGKITWSQVRGDTLTFRDPHNPLCARVNEGQEYLAYLDDDDSQVHLFQKGAYKGSIQRQQRVNVADRSAILKESGRVARARDVEQAPIRQAIADWDRSSPIFPTLTAPTPAGDTTPARHITEPIRRAQEEQKAREERARRICQAKRSPSIADMLDDADNRGILRPPAGQTHGAAKYSAPYSDLSALFGDE